MAGVAGVAGVVPGLVAPAGKRRPWCPWRGQTWRPRRRQRRQQPWWWLRTCRGRRRRRTDLVAPVLVVRVAAFLFLAAAANADSFLSTCAMDTRAADLVPAAPATAPLGSRAGAADLAAAAAAAASAADTTMTGAGRVAAAAAEEEVPAGTMVAGWALAGPGVVVGAGWVVGAAEEVDEAILFFGGHKCQECARRWERRGG